MPARRFALGLVAALALAGCGGGESPAPPQPQFFPSTGGDRAVVWAVGDGANGTGAAMEVADLAVRDRPQAFLYLGDVYENGTYEDFIDNYHSVYGKLVEVTAPTPGNHDWANRADGYQPYWRTRRVVAPSYYAFRLAGWEILSLNSEDAHDERSPQYAWLRSRLDAGTGNCRLAFWHRARFSAGLRHGDQPDIQPLWALVRGRAALVVNAHEHNMQRFRPVRGTVELVAGAGGNGLYGLDDTDRRVAFGNDTVFGALRLVLRPGRARYTFVDGAGRTLDEGTVRCRS